jgi:hypothetical protein
VGGFFFDFEAVLSTQVAADAVEAALLLRSLSGRICGLGDVVATDVAVELVEDIIKTCEAAALGAYFSVLLYLHEKEDGTIDLTPEGGGVIISWLREQGYKVDVSDVRAKIEIAANSGQGDDRVGMVRIIKQNPTKKYRMAFFVNSLNGKDWKDGKYSSAFTFQICAADFRLGNCRSVRLASEALLLTEPALAFAWLKAENCSSISGEPVDLDHADAGAVCAMREMTALGGGRSSPWTLSSMTARALVLLDDQDKVVAVSERRMTEDGPSAYSKYHPPLVPVEGAPEGFYKEPIAKDLVELAAIVKALPTIESLVMTTSTAVYKSIFAAPSYWTLKRAHWYTHRSLTTGAGTFLKDYGDKIRRDLQNADATDQQLNHAIHGDRVAAAEAALMLDSVDKFVVGASSPFGEFDTPRNDEERRSVVCGIVWKNPPTGSGGYFADGLVIEGSSGLDAAANHGLVFSSKLQLVNLDLVSITPEYDRYLADTNGRPIRLNIKNEETMRKQNRVVYDGYLAAVIAGGPHALADPILRARYAVYEEVDKSMPAYLAQKSQKARDAWKAKKYKEWVVRQRVA